MRVTVRVPATSANLGPGFDCFGLALDLCNEVTADTETEPGISWEGEGADELPTDGSDVISRAVALAAARRGRAAPAVALRARNRIPLERGLGSSTAAAIAGAAIANAILEAPADDPGDAFRVAAELDGHADNAAAAAFGGVTLVVDGVPRRLEPHPRLRPVLLIPEGLRISTAAARRALGSSVSREDAVAQIAYVAALVVGLTLDPAALATALHDRIHEDARLALVPDARDVRDRVRDAGVPVCVSGAGPSLLAFEVDGRPVPDPGGGWLVLRPAIRAEGFEVTIER